MSNPLNLQTLQTELSQAGSPWQMSETNSMTMLTEEERSRRLGFQPGPGDMSLEEAVEQDKVASKNVQAISSANIGLPNKFDNSNYNGKDFTTAVKNQGGCGSCVAFGSAAVLETTYKRQINNANFDIDLSEAQLFYCYAASEDRNCGNGWWPDRALSHAKASGVTFEEFFPYTAGNQACTLKAGAGNNEAKCTNYMKLSGANAIKNHLVTKGSVTGCFIVYQDFYAYKSGVYRHVSGSQVGGHCVELYGYDDVLGCWLCKNSWGSNWGENGRFKIGYGQCNIETWSGPYGVAGVSLRAWNNGVKVNGLWSNTSERNAWAHFNTLGWKKINNGSEITQKNMLAQLITAKAGNRNVNVLHDNNVIQEIYVI